MCLRCSARFIFVSGSVVIVTVSSPARSESQNLLPRAENLYSVAFELVLHVHPGHCQSCWLIEQLAYEAIQTLTCVISSNKARAMPTAAETVRFSVLHLVSPLNLETHHPPSLYPSPSKSASALIDSSPHPERTAATETCTSSATIK